MRCRRAGVFSGIVLFSFFMTAGPGQEPAKIFSTLDEAVPETPRLILLVFFSLDCPACYSDLIEMRYLIGKNDWPVAVIGVSSAPREEIGLFCEKYSWTLPVVRDRRKKIFRRHGVGFVPFKVLLDGGEVLYRDDPYRDYLLRREDIEEFLQKLFYTGEFS